MNNNNYSYKIVNKSSQNIASIRDRYIDLYGFELFSYGCLTENELTEVGEVSYFSTRQPKLIKFLPAFKNKSALLPYAKKGMVDELEEKSSVKGYVKTTEDINEGDLLKIEYSYFEGTLNVKYYIVKKVLVKSIVNVIGKEIMLSTYTLPISKKELNNKTYDYATVFPSEITDDYIL